MTSIDLFNDFNEESDAAAGDYEENDGENLNTSQNQPGSDNDGNPGDDNKETVEAKVKVVRVKRKLVTLNPERLKGPRGIIAIDDFYKNIKFKGKGYEKQDLDEVLKRMEHWAHRMFPKYALDDSLAVIERMGKKKEVMVHMQRYRLDQLNKDEEKIQSDDEGERNKEVAEYEDAPMDEFEKLIDEQIALSTVHAKTNDRSFGNLSSIHASVNTSKNTSNTSFSQLQSSQPVASQEPVTPASQQDPSPLSSTQVGITDEVRMRIAENKKRALAILEQRKKEAEEKKRKEDLMKQREISNILIDDDDF